MTTNPIDIHILFSINHTNQITLAHIEAINNIMLEYLTEFS